MRYYPVLFVFFTGTSWAQEQPATPAKKIQKAKDSFNELSDISRLVEEKLNKAKKTGDMEQVQCIASRQASIKALLNITKQSQLSLEESIGRQNSMRTDSELKRITVALSKAQQIATEVTTCLESIAQQDTPEEKTDVTVDKSAVTELLVGDESTFGLDTQANAVTDMSPQTTTESNSSDISSDSIAPPSDTSPYY